MPYLKLALLLILPAAARAGNPDRPTPGPDAKAAATKAIALIQEVGARWPQKQSCVSCHNQLLPLLAFKRARQHGVPVDEQRATAMLRHSLAGLQADYAIQGWNPEATYHSAFTLVAAHESGVPPNDTAAAFARLFARRQAPDGKWLFDDRRPPESFSEITSTALVLRCLQLYASPRIAAETAGRVKRARLWLETQSPHETEETVFRLFGMAWAGSDPKWVQSAVHRLIEEQRPDGGWSQLPSMASDAYATGEVLVALHDAGGLPISHQSYRRGIEFLLRTQHDDGSWLVNTRVHVPGISPDYFESGFPYGHSQFISCAATSWAVMALSLSLPSVPLRNAVSVERANLLNERLEPWAQTILFGNTGQVEALLRSGFDPNSSNRLGTTALMMAAPDPGKARLLLAAGANPNAKAKSRFTALMVASGYRGGSETVRLLLERGAEVEPANPQPTFFVSAAYLAAGAGEAETLRTLLERGANAHRQVVQFWFFSSDAILMPLLMHDEATLHCLLPHFNKEELNSGLSIPVVDNRPSFVRDLIGRGADINYVDSFGMTALHYAASLDYGDTGMVELLLRSGADTEIRTKDGLTALALAKKYGHTQIQRVLERSGAAQ